MTADKVHALEDGSYRETRERLENSDVIAGMFTELPVKLRVQLATGNLDDRWSFVQGALREYNARGGEIQTHIGGPAEALEALAVRWLDAI